jgi:hypothetical protein
MGKWWECFELFASAFVALLIVIAGAIIFVLWLKS